MATPPAPGRAASPAIVPILLYWGLYLALAALGLAILAARTGQAHLVGTLLLSRVGVVLVLPGLAGFVLGWRLTWPAPGAGRPAVFVRNTALALAIAVVTVWSTTEWEADARRLEPAEHVALLAIVTALVVLHWIPATVLRGFLERDHARRERDAAEQRRQAVEQALVRARLDPHFLFNAINSVDTLIMADAEAASRALGALAGVLRYVLYDSRGDRVPLAEELVQIERYLALQRIRTGVEDGVSWLWSGGHDGFLLPPMLLLPWVENACKHATGIREAGAVVVQAAVAGRTLRFSCANRHHGPGHVAHGPGGVGESLLRQRLTDCLPARHVLLVDHDDVRHVVHLSFDLDVDPALPRHRG